MVYTVTFNPSLDYVLTADTIALGCVNRASAGSILAGGKGINVSTVLQALGCDNTALGFIAGFTGKEIERIVTQSGCRCDFITLPDGISRINIKLKGVEVTEINSDGPVIPQSCVDELISKLDELICEGDFLVLAGSIPSSLPDTVYRDIVRALRSKNIKIIVDASGRLLLNALEERPYLVKPNHIELGEIFDTEIKTADDALIYAQKLQGIGAGNVLVSMAQNGAVLITDSGEKLFCSAPRGKAINTVGAGDSMVAGFICGCLAGDDPEYALKMGIAAGSASAFSEGLAQKDGVMSLLEQIHVQKM